MSSRKNENTALKSEEDFTSEILSDELHQALDKSSDDSAEEFLKTLKHEMQQQAEANPENTEIEEVAKKPEAREYDDKTAVLSDDVQSTADFENVTSLDDVKAGIVQQNIQRNPSIDLKNADYIKFAQEKIKKLEKEVGDLRVEAQELALAGGHFKALAEEREFLTKSMEAKISELESTSREEKKILNEALEAKETKVLALQSRVESLEDELESKYNRLRVRERELESRLEILKQEQDAVASSKDDMILRVKKQNNALTSDLERARSQTQKTATQLQEKEDALRRTIKALKLSLTMLESQKHN
ncbi:MAG: hypothetical protein ACRBBP_04130 [Bdellovibrionales bacterium]